MSDEAVFLGGGDESGVELLGQLGVGEQGEGAGEFGFVGQGGGACQPQRRRRGVGLEAVDELAGGGEVEDGLGEEGGGEGGAIAGGSAGGGAASMEGGLGG
ncbi:MAG: hypothetical protein M9913_23350 [Bryobacteraceae bacterium]|nr:hypothetical protein [Bryobacteraceae bacterium]